MSSWFDEGGTGDPVDVRAVMEGLGTQGIHELVEAGALVSMGTTSDGGALGVTVTVDGKWRREYFRQGEDLVAWIAQALPAVEAARGTNRPSSGNGRRTRPRTTR